MTKQKPGKIENRWKIEDIRKDISASADAAANCSGFVSTLSFRRSDLVWGDAPQISAVTFPSLEYWMKAPELALITRKKKTIKYNYVY